jgi:23S rRNA (uracil1939-C5)-methyltransferase
VTLHCAHFGHCGGCTALDVPIARQLADKVAHARTVLGDTLGAVELQCEAPRDTPHHDRLKLLYPARPGVDGSLHLGLYAAGSHQLVTIEQCELQARPLTILAQRVEATLRRFGVGAYDEVAHRGCVRALQARIMPGTGELLVGLVTNEDLPTDTTQLGDALLAAAEGLPRATRSATRLVGLVHNRNTTRGNVLLGPQTRTLAGRDHQFDRVDGLSLRVSFNSFYQVHRHANAILYRPALAMLGPVAGRRIVDGYGGVGTFATRLARAGAARVQLVESNPWACADARHNASANGLADVVEVIEAPFGGAPLQPGADLAVVDPPRAGLGEAGCRQVLELLPERVLYVSCSVESLARDLRVLAPRFRPNAARLCDMFPHTPHAEVVMLLARNS